MFVDGFAAPLLGELSRAMEVVHRAFARDGYGVDVELKVVHTPDGPRLFLKQARLLRLAGP